MKLTGEEINAKLQNETIKQNECTKRAFEIAALLTGQPPGFLPTDLRPKSTNDAMAAIKGAIKDGSIVIAWFQQGYDGQNRSRQHCYFIFDDAPLRSFTAFEDGLHFIGEAETMNKLAETFAVDGEMGVHVYPLV